MTPEEYEGAVAAHFAALGFAVERTPYSGDYGVDVFASRGAERVAVQAKMYGGSTRRVNRQALMELHGAAAYFDCTRAVLATNGELLPDAVDVAAKLGIEVIRVGSDRAPVGDPVLPLAVGGGIPSVRTESGGWTFGRIWEEFVMPLQGKTLHGAGGGTNRILRADWGGIERVTSNGRKGRIPIEPFEHAVHALLRDGVVTRADINDSYAGRASSGIMLVLSQVPFFGVGPGSAKLVLLTDGRDPLPG